MATSNRLRILGIQVKLYRVYWITLNRSWKEMREITGRYLNLQFITNDFSFSFLRELEYVRLENYSLIINHN